MTINYSGQAIKWQRKIYKPGDEIPDDQAEMMGLNSMEAQKRGVKEQKRKQEIRPASGGKPMVMIGDPNRHEQPSVKSEPSVESEDDAIESEEAQQTPRKRKPRA